MSNKKELEGYDAEFGDTYFDIPHALGILQSPTAPELIEKKSQRNGPALDYVSAATVIRTINKAFGLRWSFRVHETRVVESVPHQNNEQRPVVQTLGELTIPGLGSRMQWGSQSVIGGQSQQEHTFKGSSSDALKKCAAMFLVHLDLADNGPKGNQAIAPSDLPERDLEALKAMMAEQNANQAQDSAEAASQQAQEQVQQTPETQQPTNSQPQNEKPQGAQPVESPQQQAQNQSQQTAPEEVIIPEAVQESLNTIPDENGNVEPAPQQTPSPQQQETPAPIKPVQTQANRWSKEDVETLKGHKERLGIQMNEDLDPYIQDFFGSDEMTFRHLTPTTIKDFNHFLSAK